MDVHVMGHRAQSVRGIQIAIALHMGKAAPLAFAFTRGQNSAQVVQVSRLAMRDFAEKTIPHHAEDHHLVRAVTAVLEDNAMLARSLGSIDDFPALLQRRAGGYFDGGMLA